MANPRTKSPLAVVLTTEPARDAGRRWRRLSELLLSKPPGTKEKPGGYGHRVMRGILDTDSLNQPTETGNPASGLVSLGGLLDLLDVLEEAVNELPPPAPLFAHELARTLAEALGAGSDDG